VVNGIKIKERREGGGGGEIRGGEARGWGGGEAARSQGATKLLVGAGGFRLVKCVGKV
jgi:hypothetical protein